MTEETQDKRPKRTSDEILVDHRESKRGDVYKLEQRLMRAREEVGALEGKLKTTREQLERLEKATGYEPPKGVAVPG
jgi:HAMP domain-containing protein